MAKVKQQTIHDAVEIGGRMMNHYTVWANDLGYRSITYTCYDDPMAGGPYDWTVHFTPQDLDEYGKMIQSLETQGYVHCQHMMATPPCEAGPQLVPALLRRLSL